MGIICLVICFVSAGAWICDKIDNRFGSGYSFLAIAGAMLVAGIATI